VPAGSSYYNDHSSEGIAKSMYSIKILTVAKMGHKAGNLFRNLGILRPNLLCPELERSTIYSEDLNIFHTLPNFT